LSKLICRSTGSTFVEKAKKAKRLVRAIKGCQRLSKLICRSTGSTFVVKGQKAKKAKKAKRPKRPKRTLKVGEESLNYYILNLI
jgi:hypothetical protein